MEGFKYEIERPWSHEGAPEFHKVTLNGKEIDLKQLVDIAERMRLELQRQGVIMVI